MNITRFWLLATLTFVLMVFQAVSTVPTIVGISRMLLLGIMMYLVWLSTDDYGQFGGDRFAH